MTHAINRSVFVLLWLAVMAAPSLAGASGNADGAYRMAVVLDRAHGETISRGHYRKAIKRIRREHAAFPFAAATNLCVAKTMTGQYSEAHRFCDEALALAAEAGRTGKAGHRDYTREQAIAWSNRGVLRVQTGDVEGAGRDFARALALQADTEAPAHNLARLNTQRAGIAGAR